MRIACLILLPPVLLLAGCQKPDTAPGPGGVTLGEARALDEAAAMLDERRPPAEALPSPQDGASGTAAAE